MIIRGDRFTRSEKYEVLSTISSDWVIILSGFLAGVVAALAIVAAAWSVSLLDRSSSFVLLTVVWEFSLILGLLGSVAAKLMQYEYRLNRDQYKRGTAIDLYIPLVYPFYLFCLFLTFLLLSFRTMKVITAFPVELIVILLLICAGLASIIFSLFWRSWYHLFISLLSKVDYQLVLDRRRFIYQLRLSFAEVKRYSSQLSVIVAGIDQEDSLARREFKLVLEKLFDLLGSNLRCADAIGRLDTGRLLAVLIHTGGAGALVAAERIRAILRNESFSPRREKGEITVSIGIGIYTDDIDTYEALLERGERALAHAREEGKNCIYSI